jgi:hypothetical protein
LIRRREGAERDGFATSAIRLGVLALEQATGALDTAAVRHEGETLVAQIRVLLLENSSQFSNAMTNALTRYFDPSDGDLPQRLDRLVRRDGELESLLARHLDGESSTIARTLSQHLGEGSPVLRLLSPTARGGLVDSLRDTVEEALRMQKEAVLRQFSLDDPGSAISRLVSEVTDANGQLRQDIAVDLSTVRAEFSLDNEQGALSRLVARVERAQQLIGEQFSLDNQNSALSRLAALFERQQASNTVFQAEIRAMLESFRARREEAARSTRHGDEFEDSVGEVLRPEAQRLGDSFEATGCRPGSLRNCKVGDFVLTLSPESRAPGARIVIEAKENASYDVASALAELCTARENRQAVAGIFVFSQSTAPPGLEPLSRHGDDFLVVWDRDNLSSDVYLKASLSVARAIVFRAQIAAEASSADFEAIDKAVSKLTKDIEDLAEISTWTGNIKRDGNKIEDRVAKVHHNLQQQMELLQEHLQGLK